MGVWQGRADLERGEVISKTFRADARAMVAVEEVLLIEKTVKADPRFQEALRRRGLLAEVDNMCIDPWTVGRIRLSRRNRAGGSSTASSGCALSRWTTTTPTRSRDCTR